MKIARVSRWPTALGVAAAAGLLSCSYLSTRPDEKAVSTAQDEVYETVVRELITAPGIGASEKQLVFSDALLTDRRTGEDAQTCEESVRKRERWLDDAPPYDSVLDKAYRLVTLSWVDGSAQVATVEDFLEKSCYPGHLSRTFHTDLPKRFAASDGLGGGVISFSRVGFDRALDEAMVSVSFECGFLCGTGWRYILKKRHAKWNVVGKRIIWVS